MKANVTRENLVSTFRKHIKLSDINKKVDEIIELVLKKNHDYGDAWQSNEIFTPLVRLKDKLIRIETLSDGRKALVADEDIKETLRDNIGYSLLALLWLDVNTIKDDTTTLSSMSIEEQVHTILHTILHENDEPDNVNFHFDDFNDE